MIRYSRGVKRWAGLALFIYTMLCGFTWATEAEVIKPTASAGAAYPITTGRSPVKSAEDISWEDLTTVMSPAERADRKQAPDWVAIESKAREFKTKNPQDPRAKEAFKIEIIAALKGETEKEKEEKRKAGTDASARAENFLSDKSNPSKDRYEVRFVLNDRNLSRSKLRTKKERDALRTRNARKLVEEFPEEPRSYGYLLSLAKGQPGGDGKILANEILQSKAPKEVKDAAATLVAQRELEGKPLVVSGLALEAHRGRPLLIYAWSAKRPEIFDLVRRCAAIPGVVPIGINIDEDPAPARQLAATLEVPGVIVYEAAGLSGPLAGQLKFTRVNSVYIVDQNGVLTDVSAHARTTEKLSKLIDQAGVKGASK